MAANARVRKAWKNGPTVSGAELAALDANLAGLLNGDGGGVYSPSQVLNIGGAGMYALGAWIMAGAGTADCSTPASSGKRIVHADGDAFVLYGSHSGQTQTVEQSFVDAVSVRGQTYISQSVYLACTTLQWVACLSLPLRVRDGASLYSAAVSFIVTDPHSGGIPALLPKMRLVATAIDGTKVPLKTEADGADRSGWIRFPTPISGAAWHAAGAVQTWNFVTTAGIAQRTVQRSAYTYALEIVEEGGVGAFAPGVVGVGNQWVGCVTTTHGVFDLRPE